jgi:hypothetical protein
MTPGFGTTSIITNAKPPCKVVANSVGSDIVSDSQSYPLNFSQLEEQPLSRTPRLQLDIPPSMVNEENVRTPRVSPTPQIMSFRYPVQVSLNPSGRFAGAECFGERLDSEALDLRFGFPTTSPTEEEYCRALRDGFSSYVSEPPEGFGPLPCGIITIERITYHEGASDVGAFRVVGAFVAREFHKLTHANSL